MRCSRCLQTVPVVNDYRLTAGGVWIGVFLDSESLWIKKLHMHTHSHTPRSCQSCGFQAGGVSLASVFRHCSLE